MRFDSLAEHKDDKAFELTFVVTPAWFIRLPQYRMRAEIYVLYVRTAPHHFCAPISSSSDPHRKAARRKRQVLNAKMITCETRLWLHWSGVGQKCKRYRVITFIVYLTKETKIHWTEYSDGGNKSSKEPDRNETKEIKRVRK